MVGFNGGTTTSATARQLAARADLARSSDRPAITVVSNALNIASEMVLRPFIRCVSLGGVARPESYEQFGPLAAMVLEQLWLDSLILGVDALSASDGASCDHDGEAGINSLMVRRADRVIVVTTGDKVGRRSFARICESSAIHVLVTDQSAPETELEAFRTLGIEIVIA